MGQHIRPGNINRSVCVCVEVSDMSAHRKWKSIIIHDIYNSETNIKSILYYERRQELIVFLHLK